MDETHEKKNEFLMTRIRVFRFCNQVRDKDWPYRLPIIVKKLSVIGRRKVSPNPSNP